MEQLLLMEDHSHVFPFQTLHKSPVQKLSRRASKTARARGPELSSPASGPSGSASGPSAFLLLPSRVSSEKHQEPLKWRHANYSSNTHHLE